VNILMTKLPPGARIERAATVSDSRRVDTIDSCRPGSPWRLPVPVLLTQPIFSPSAIFIKITGCYSRLNMGNHRFYTKILKAKEVQGTIKIGCTGTSWHTYIFCRENEKNLENGGLYFFIEAILGTWKREKNWRKRNIQEKGIYRRKTDWGKKVK
jgi:hypothetical protein